MALALMGALLLLVGIGVKLWDYRRKREAEAVHLQSQISDALLREPDFFGLAITPTVHAGMRRGAPMKIELTGQAPSPTVRDAALRVVRDEATRMGYDFEIEDQIDIRPEVAQRIA
jgi:type II secretory pathway component PulM